jgi:hypothetical protein
MFAFFKTQPFPSESVYAFSSREIHYDNFRPQWPSTFALASLQQVGFRYDRLKRIWYGPAGRCEPVVLSVGAGAGADASAFLELNCRVYAVEPNDAFRAIASRRFASYGDKFLAIDGNAHALNLPLGLKVDLIVCAQALHTFRSEILHIAGSEERARKAWREFLPNDNKDRIAIWYYNLDPTNSAMLDLHDGLKSVSARYAASQTPFLNAPLFEPTEFQHYIQASRLSISAAKTMASLSLTKAALMSWLKSYSFGPKEGDDETAVTELLSIWFDRYRKGSVVHLTYVGFIAQGPLRRTEYKNVSRFSMQASPLFLKRVEGPSVFSKPKKPCPHYALPTQSSMAKSKEVLPSRERGLSKLPQRTSCQTLSMRYFSSTISSQAKQTEKYTSNQRVRFNRN